MDPIRERALRRELRNARTTRPSDVPAILDALGEGGTRADRGGETASRAAAPTPAKRRKPAAKGDGGKA